MMTLIISCITPDYCFQVSDRRLTDLKGNTFEDEYNNEYEYNKSILLKNEGMFSFAYTGLAYLDDEQRSDQWFIKRIAKSQLHTTELLNSIAEQCTQAINRIDISKQYKRLAFVGIGWAYTNVKEKTELLPIYIIISNFHDKRGNWSNEIHERFSSLVITPHKSSNIEVFCAGQLISDDRIMKLKRNLRKCIKSNREPSAMGILLIQAVRDVSKVNKLVGQDLMITTLPKQSIKRNSLLAVSSKPSKDEITFLYIPKGKFEGVSYGPNFVAPNSWAFTNFEINYL